MRLTRRRVLAGALALGASTRGYSTEVADRAPLLEGMGGYVAADASGSARARRYFAQGMVLAWGFNPAEAARSFVGAAASDEQCAAAWWGQAWSLGPSINADMAAADAPRVDAALRRARALRDAAAPRWRALIDALSLRHPASGTSAIDEPAYQRRMQALARQFAGDADVAALAAEAMMNLHPYDWWRPDGSAQPWTAEILRLLRHALDLNPGHPGANHAWVHVLERSNTPQRAQVQADRLRSLVPGCGHLLHMPAHIDMRLGRYAAASQANERAIAADLRYLAQVDAQGAHRVGYVAHNHHFLWASAAMEGRSARAIEAARAAYPAACGPRPGDRGAGTLQYLQALPLYALVRFGRWEELLTGAAPPDGDEPYPLALWHYARGTALVRVGRAADAGVQLGRLEQVSRAPALAAARVKGIHAAATLVDIARLTLQADLALAQGATEPAIRWLAQAVALEDGLEHDEPHLWLAPTRHALGAALLTGGTPAQAARVFAQDLGHYPDNGWALAGLARAQRQLGDVSASRASEAHARAAWRGADIPLAGPRL